tara:strand:- start:1568 stop:2002 length:435 start_codon:yes stop_codon:yes gene_type:complete
MATAKTASASATAPATSTAKSQKDDSVRIVGLLKNAKTVQSQNPQAKFQVTGFLGVNTKDNFNDKKVDVDLPGDNFIASDNGQKLASEILELQGRYKWIKIAMTGFWVSGARTELVNGYCKSGRKQLRVQKYEVLSFGNELETK